jgi:hypothetical protein
MTPRGLDSSITPEYLDLQALAVYSSCSVRWLRNRLADRRAPLPHHRVEGKILVSKKDFDQWISRFRTIQEPSEVDMIVDGVIANVLA